MRSRLLLTLTTLTLAIDATPAASQVTPAVPPQIAPQPARPVYSDPIPSPQPVAQPVPLVAPDSSRYQVWIVVKPDGLHFVQKPDELRSIQENPPANAFVIACHEFDMDGSPGEGIPRFVLVCRQAAVCGRYGTQKWVSMEGQNLVYDTHEQTMRITGSEDTPARFSVEDGDEMQVTATQIQLQLGASKYQMHATGVQIEFHAEPAAPLQPAGFSNPSPYSSATPGYSPPLPVPPSGLPSYSPAVYVPANKPKK